MVKVKVCPICGNEFTGRAKYCSHECKLKARRSRYATKAEKAKVVKVCPICGTEFKGTSKDKYCSDECANTARERQLNEYNDNRNNARYTRSIKVMNRIHEISPDTQLGFGSWYEVEYRYGSSECESDIRNIESKWAKYAKMEEEIKSSHHH